MQLDMTAALGQAAAYIHRVALVAPPPCSKIGAAAGAAYLGAVAAIRPLRSAEIAFLVGTGALPFVARRGWVATA